MKPGQPFPLEAFSTRVRDAILSEFKGRRPTILEVARIPDAQWLATPAIGPRTVSKIRLLTREFRDGSDPSLARLTDAELLTQHDFLLAAFKQIEGELKATGTELWIRGIHPLFHRA